MTLQDYLAKKHMTETAFADLIGIKPSGVNRLMPVDGRPPLRKPGWKLMSVIATVTGGQVMPNDFMDDLPELADEDDKPTPPATGSALRPEGGPDRASGATAGRDPGPIRRAS